MPPASASTTLGCVLSEDRGVWRIQCSRCLTSFDGQSWTSRDAAAAELEAAYWEIRLDGRTWCPKCAREAREVPFRPTARGLPRRRK